MRTSMYTSLWFTFNVSLVPNFKSLQKNVLSLTHSTGCRNWCDNRMVARLVSTMHHVVRFLSQRCLSFYIEIFRCDSVNMFNYVVY